MSGRDAQIKAFLTAAGWGGASRAPLADDASFRRYERLQDGGRVAVLMDASPPLERIRPFHDIQRLLLAMGFSPPRDLAVDETAGLLLLEDLGDRTFTRALAEGADETALYRLAIDLLIDLRRAWPEQAASAAAIPSLGPYDEAVLQTEALLLTDWYYEAVTGRAMAAADRARYLELWRPLWPVARAQPETLVLRDYHVDNLMVLPGRDGTKACGLLDFQDALIGSPAYDLVSLLEDARRPVDPALAEAMLARYLAAFPEFERDAFMAAYAILGAQRNAKIIGIFTRLSRRDGKQNYLGLIPHVWGLLEGDLAHPLLGDLKDWFDAVLPPGLRCRPAPSAAVAKPAGKPGEMPGELKEG